MPSIFHAQRSRLRNPSAGLVIAGLATLALAGVGVAGPNGFYRIAEHINEHSDIAGWQIDLGDGTGGNGCGAFLITVDITVDGPVSHHYGLASENDASTFVRALASRRSDEGNILVCGYTGEVAPFRPQLWHVDPACGVVTNLPLSGLYDEGLLADIVSDDANDRWIIVGQGEDDQATTLVVPYGVLDSEPVAMEAYESDGTRQQLVTQCHYDDDAQCDSSDVVTATALRAWSIAKSDSSVGSWHVVGRSTDLESIDFNNDYCGTFQLGFRDSLEGLSDDFEIPSNGTFLMEPSNWLCLNEILDNCDDDGIAGSLELVDAFDILPDGTVYGSVLKVMNSDLYPQADDKKFRPYKNDPANELPMMAPFSGSVDDMDAIALNGTILADSSNEHRVVGVMQRGPETGGTASSGSVIRASHIDFGAPNLNAHRAVEWEIDDGISVRDLTEYRTDDLPGGVVLLTAVSINSSGSIVGLAKSDDSDPIFGYLLTEDADDPFINLDAVVDASPCSCPEDLNGDSTVSGADFGLLLGAWGTADPQADLNGDGVVAGADIGALLGQWGPCSGL